MVQLIDLVSKLSPQLHSALENAVGEAIKRKAQTVDVPHWIFHAIFGASPDVLNFLEEQGADLSRLQASIEKQMPYGHIDGQSKPTISGELSKLIEDAWLIASIDLNRQEITVESLLLAALSPSGFGFRGAFISDLEMVSTDKLRTLAKRQNKESGSKRPVHESGISSTTEGALGQFTINLTQQAREAALDPVLGRNKEISKALDVLLRKRQNNPILLGLPGVGKTAIVEGLAQKIISGDVPEQLKNAELLSLDMGLLQAGASVKGAFEERLKNVLAEVKASDTPILMFIDEAHTMIGAGGAEGQNDAANLLKPALARGDFRTIAATTYAEYKQYFEKDPALSRRFQPIDVAEPDPETAINILRGVSDGLAKHHAVLIHDDAIRSAVDLSIRFMPSRRLPDKAISILDTACARVALSQQIHPEEIESLSEQVAFAQTALDRAQSDLKKFGSSDADIQVLEHQLQQLQDDLTQKTSQWSQEKIQFSAAENGADLNQFHGSYIHPWVGQKTVSQVVSDWTGVPVLNLQASEAERLLSLGETLKHRVIGQDTAIDAIARSLQISRAGLTDARKPIGVFLMCGPSGVGKTETALAIAEHVFGGETAITTINMTEFKEAHKSSMLLGAAAGYVGYGKGGVLTEAIRRKPYSVLLLDEMEKAHPAIHDIFFQIFDKGTISDSEGQQIDFKNTIIIMTSNAGGEDIRDFIDSCDHDPTSDEINAYLRPKLLDYFSPAFLGRTELIAYRPLNNETAATITKLHLGRIQKRLLAQYGAEFIWDNSFVDHIVASNNDPLSGGRAIELTINKKFLPMLAEACIKYVIDKKKLSLVKVGHDGNEVTLELG